MRADARQTRIRDLLKAREAPLIFRKNEAERSCAAAKSGLLGPAVQLPGEMSVLAVEGAKDLPYMADQKKDTAESAVGVRGEGGPGRGAGQPTAHPEEP